MSHTREGTPHPESVRIWSWAKDWAAHVSTPTTGSSQRIRWCHTRCSVNICMLAASEVPSMYKPCHEERAAIGFSRTTSHTSVSKTGAMGKPI